MAKIHRYSLSNMKTSVGHISESYKEEELRNLLFETNNILEENIEENVEEEDNNQQTEELENINNTEENLLVEKSIDLGPWVVIEVGQLPNITVISHNSSDDDDDDEDFDPKELAREINKYKTNIEDNEN